MRARAFLLLPLILLFAAPAAAQQGASYVSEAGGFRVELPAGWSQVSEAALAAVRRGGHAEAGGLAYEAGFQAGSARWPAPPMAVIARLPLEDELSLEDFSAQFTPEEAQAQLQGSQAEAAGIRADVPHWDAENAIGWVRMRPGSGPDFIWQGMKLHPDGRSVIMLVYYAAPNQDEAAIRAQMLAVLQSLRGS